MYIRTIKNIFLFLFLFSCSEYEKIDFKSQKYIIDSLKNIIEVQNLKIDSIANKAGSQKPPKYSVVKNISNLGLEIQLVKNEIFARKGRKFNSQFLNDYFSSFRWYKQNDQYSDALLTGSDLRDIQLLKLLGDSLKFYNHYEIEFIKNTLKQIKKFRYSKIDTHLLAVGYIDSDLKMDTVSTHIFFQENKVFVEHIWKKKGKVRWKHRQNDHGKSFYISNRPLFLYENANIWFILNNVLEKSFFEFTEKTLSPGYPAMINSFSSQFDKSTIENYVRDSVKQVVIYERLVPNTRIDFWYEPLEKFLPYYRP